MTAPCPRPLAAARAASGVGKRSRGSLPAADRSSYGVWGAPIAIPASCHPAQERRCGRWRRPRGCPAPARRPRTPPPREGPAAAAPRRHMRHHSTTLLRAPRAWGLRDADGRTQSISVSAGRAGRAGPAGTSDMHQPLQEGRGKEMPHTVRVPRARNGWTTTEGHTQRGGWQRKGRRAARSGAARASLGAPARLAAGGRQRARARAGRGAKTRSWNRVAHAACSGASVRRRAGGCAFPQTSTEAWLEGGSTRAHQCGARMPWGWGRRGQGRAKECSIEAWPPPGRCGCVRGGGVSAWPLWVAFKGGGLVASEQQGESGAGGLGGLGPGSPPSRLGAPLFISPLLTPHQGAEKMRGSQLGLCSAQGRAIEGKDGEAGARGAPMPRGRGRRGGGREHSGSRKEYEAHRLVNASAGQWPGPRGVLMCCCIAAARLCRGKAAGLCNLVCLLLSIDGQN
jgi:hypothetical protein